MAGPFPPAEPHHVAKKALDLRSGLRRRVREPDPDDSLAHRAYRRPVTAAEVAQLTGIFNRARAAAVHARAEPAVRDRRDAGLAAVPVPHRARSAGRARSARISDVELASRLSYFLWSSMPDDELLRLARGQPSAPARGARRAGHADDRRSEIGGLLREFRRASGWRRAASMRSSATRSGFPNGTPSCGTPCGPRRGCSSTRCSARTGRSSDFIDGEYTFLNERLAKHYGIAGVEGPEFRRVELHDRPAQRRLHAGERPDGVELSDAHVGGAARQVPARERAQCAASAAAAGCAGARRSVGRRGAVASRADGDSIGRCALCASCHTRMDPLGFALENYDAIGRWRTEDGKFPVDASGAFPNGRTFSGPGRNEDAASRTGCPSSRAASRRRC